VCTCAWGRGHTVRPSASLLGPGCQGRGYCAICTSQAGLRGFLTIWRPNPRYTLNLEKSALAILERLGMVDTSAVPRVGVTRQLKRLGDTSAVQRDGTLGSRVLGRACRNTLLRHGASEARAWIAQAGVRSTRARQPMTSPTPSLRRSRCRGGTCRQAPPAWSSPCGRVRPELNVKRCSRQPLPQAAASSASQHSSGALLSALASQLGCARTIPTGESKLPPDETERLVPARRPPVQCSGAIAPRPTSSALRSVAARFRQSAQIAQPVRAAARLCSGRRFSGEAPEYCPVLGPCCAGLGQLPQRALGQRRLARIRHAVRLPVHGTTKLSYCAISYTTLRHCTRYRGHRNSPAVAARWAQMQHAVRAHEVLGHGQRTEPWLQVLRPPCPAPPAAVAHVQRGAAREGARGVGRGAGRPGGR
jgi:hypothetical protein